MGVDGIPRASDERRALTGAGRYDFLGRYVDDLPSVIDLAAIRDVRRSHRRRPDGRCVASPTGARSPSGTDST